MENISSRYNIIDLFSGAGGFSLGAVRAGFNLVAAAELDSKAIDTHKRNFTKSTHLQIDLNKTTGSDILNSLGLKKGDITGVIGGPPCQGFSTIGHRNVKDTRNNLFVRFFNIVKEINPAFFVAENVPGIMNEQYKDIRKKALSEVSHYIILEPFIVKANDYGAPTTRTRIFFVGYDPKRLKDITERDFESMKVDSKQHIYVRDALSGLPLNITNIKKGFGTVDWKKIKEVDENKKFFYERIHGKQPEYIGDTTVIKNYISLGKITGCLPTKHSAEVKKRYKNLKYKQQDAVSKSVRLDPAGFCPTLRAGTGPEKGSYQAVRPIHYSESRVITPREAARLQGFPDWFDFQPTIWHSFRQIGNSVSPIVAEKILSAIYYKLK